MTTVTAKSTGTDEKDTINGDDACEDKKMKRMRKIHSVCPENRSEVIVYFSRLLRSHTLCKVFMNFLQNRIYFMYIISSDFSDILFRSCYVIL